MAEWAVESAYCMLRNCKSEAQAKVAAALIASRLR